MRHDELPRHESSSRERSAGEIVDRNVLCILAAVASSAVVLHCPARPLCSGILVRVLLFATLPTSWNLVGGFGDRYHWATQPLGLGAYTLAILGPVGRPVVARHGGGGVAATAPPWGSGLSVSGLRGPYSCSPPWPLAEMLREIATNQAATKGASGLTVVPLFSWRWQRLITG